MNDYELEKFVKDLGIRIESAKSVNHLWKAVQKDE